MWALAGGFGDLGSEGWTPPRRGGTSTSGADPPPQPPSGRRSHRPCRPSRAARRTDGWRGDGSGTRASGCRRHRRCPGQPPDVMALTERLAVLVDGIPPTDLAVAVVGNTRRRTLRSKKQRRTGTISAQNNRPRSTVGRPPSHRTTHPPTHSPAPRRPTGMESRRPGAA